MKAREGCLGQLKLQEKMLQLSKDDVSETLTKVSELMTHLRILTLNCVETINKWKESLSYYFLLANNVLIKQNALFLPYMYEGENYLFKITHDLDFLSLSAFSHFFNFSKNDPFLLQSTFQDENTHKIIQYISKNLIYRIKLCQEMLANELKNMKMNKEKPPKHYIVRPISRPPLSKNNPQEWDSGKKSQNSFSNDKDSQLHTPANTENNMYSNKKDTAKEIKPFDDQPQILKNNEMKNEEKKHTSNKENEFVQSIRKKSSIKNKENENENLNNSTRKSNKSIEISRKSGKNSLEVDLSPGRMNNSANRISPSSKRNSSRKKSSLKIKKENLEIKPLELMDFEVEGFLSEYMRKVDNKTLMTVLSDVGSICELNNREDLHFLTLKYENQTQGLAILHVDKGFFAFKRLIILHFSLLKGLDQVLIFLLFFFVLNHSKNYSKCN